MSHALRNRRLDSNRRACLAVTRLENRDVPATLIPGFIEQSVATGLSSPTAMEFAPDGKLFICEQGGTLEVWQNGASLIANRNFFTPSPLTVNSAGERGLLGIAFDPDYANNHFLYVYYTATTPNIHNRVSRFTSNTDANPSINGTQVVPGSEVILFELDGLSATNHNGGATHFGPDGKLYFAAGENANSANSQTLSNVLGKIMRINSDGTIPTDNPFFNTATGKNRAIWVMGLRNPFTFTFQPGTGKMHINDVGQNTWEEIDVGSAGANYGWPTTEGDFNQASFPNFTRPFYTYNHTTGTVTGSAITGGAFYNPQTQMFPSDYAGDYFFADYVSNWIKRIDLQTSVVSDFASNAGAAVDLRVGADGSLYYLSITSGVVNRVVSAPRVTSTVVNAGDTQRSSVTQIALTFNQPVTFLSTADAAFSLSRNGGGIVGFSTSTSVVNGVTVVTLNNFTGSETDLGSLIDGRYTLTALAPQIRKTLGANTLTLDGDGNGTTGDNFTFGDAQGLFRFFGDVSGDRRIDISDFGAFSLSYNLASTDPGYNPIFDYNGDNRIDIADFGQFSIRYFTNLP